MVHESEDYENLYNMLTQNKIIVFAYNSEKELRLYEQQNGTIVDDEKQEAIADNKEDFIAFCKDNKLKYLRNTSLWKLGSELPEKYREVLVVWEGSTHTDITTRLSDQDNRWGAINKWMYLSDLLKLK